MSIYYVVRNPVNANVCVPVDLSSVYVACVLRTCSECVCIRKVSNDGGTEPLRETKTLFLANLFALGFSDISFFRAAQALVHSLRPFQLVFKPRYLGLVVISHAFHRSCSTCQPSSGLLRAACFVRANRGSLGEPLTHCHLDLRMTTWCTPARTFTNSQRSPGSAENTLQHEQRDIFQEQNAGGTWLRASP